MAHVLIIYTCIIQNLNYVSFCNIVINKYYLLHLFYDLHVKMTFLVRITWLSFYVERRIKTSNKLLGLPKAVNIEETSKDNLLKLKGSWN